MQQLSELFNVNHFIVSQVNAHSALLASISFKVREKTSRLVEDGREGMIDSEIDEGKGGKGGGKREDQ